MFVKQIVATSFDGLVDEDFWQTRRSSRVLWLRLDDLTLANKTRQAKEGMKIDYARRSKYDKENGNGLISSPPPREWIDGRQKGNKQVDGDHRQQINEEVATERLL